MHCLSVADSKLLIVDPDSGCQARIESSRGEIEATGAKIFTLDHNLKQDIAARPVVRPPDELRNGTKPEWPWALIYTSGTTGLPKGAPYTLGRVYVAGAHLEPALGCKRGKDCWYWYAKRWLIPLK